MNKDDYAKFIESEKNKMNKELVLMEQKRQSVNRIRKKKKKT